MSRSPNLVPLEHTVQPQHFTASPTSCTDALKDQFSAIKNKLVTKFAPVTPKAQCDITDDITGGTCLPDDVDKMICSQLPTALLLSQPALHQEHCTIQTVEILLVQEACQ
jgi:actin-like ATPase involved in cell morphogenesis